MSNEQLIKNLQFIGSHYPKIAPVQTVGVIADVCNAVLVIKTQEQEIERLEAERTEFICKKCYLRQDSPNQKKASF